MGSRDMSRDSCRMYVCILFCSHLLIFHPKTQSLAIILWPSIFIYLLVLGNGQQAWVQPIGNTAILCE